MTIDRFHLDLFEGRAAEVAARLQEVRPFVRFPEFLADRMRAPYDISLLVIEYLPEIPSPSSWIFFSAPLSERNYEFIVENTPLLNVRGTRVPRVMIDALFIASLNPDPTCLRELLAVNAPAFNTLWFNPCVLETPVLESQYSPEQMALFRQQAALFEEAGYPVQQIRETMRVEQSKQPLWMMHHQLVNQMVFIQENEPDSLEGALETFDFMMTSLTPSRVVREIANTEYAEDRPLFCSTLIARKRLEIIDGTFVTFVSKESPKFSQYKQILETMIAHTHAFSPEEIRYARSQTVLLKNAGLLSPLDFSYGAIDFGDEELCAYSQFHLIGETIADQELDNWYSCFEMLINKDKQPFGRYALEFEKVKEDSEMKEDSLSDESESD